MAGGLAGAFGDQENCGRGYCYSKEGKGHVHSILWWISAGWSTDAGVRVHIAGGRVSGCMRGGVGLFVFGHEGTWKKDAAGGTMATR